MPETAYRMCTRCVMDTTDPAIEFDDDGVCSHCHRFDKIIKPRWPGEAGASLLQETVGRIKKAGKGQEYDCIIGLSGGLDSSYVAVQVREFGLRPLVVHVDAGWNTELAVNNIEQVVKHCGYDLHTHVMNWEEMKDLQLSYLKAGISNQDVPQDHAFFSALYHYATRNKVKYIISGGNYATESILPESWENSAMDASNLLDIHRKHGTIPLKDFRPISIWEYYIIYPFLYGLKTVRPLNFMNYEKKEALTFLKKKVGYKEYGYKHGESIFTRFFQGYYLPRKFGYDKRKAHLSSLILSGQCTREEALTELSRPIYTEQGLREDMAYIAKKLGISLSAFEELINAPGKDYREYKNWDKKLARLKRMQALAQRMTGKSLNNYS